MNLPMLVFRFPTDEAADGKRVAFEADYIRILSAPELADLRVRIGAPDGPELRSTDAVRDVWICGQTWHETYLSWDAVAGGEIAVLLGRGVRARMDDDLEVRESPSTGITAGTKAVPDAVSGAEPIAADLPCRELLVQADAGNADTVTIGSASAQPIELEAGAAIVLPVENANLVYVVAPNAGNSVAYLTRS